MKITQERLRELGFEVQVDHKRYYEQPDDRFDFVTHLSVVPVCEHEIRSVFGSLAATTPNGGQTMVTLTSSRGTHTGYADCSLRDPYNRQKGFQIAARRALVGLTKDLCREERRRIWHRALGIEEGVAA